MGANTVISVTFEKGRVMTRLYGTDCTLAWQQAGESRPLGTEQVEGGLAAAWAKAPTRGTDRAL